MAQVHPTLVYVVRPGSLTIFLGDSLSHAVPIWPSSSGEHVLWVGHRMSYSLGVVILMDDLHSVKIVLHASTSTKSFLSSINWHCQSSFFGCTYEFFSWRRAPRRLDKSPSGQEHRLRAQAASVAQPRWWLRRQRVKNDDVPQGSNAARQTPCPSDSGLAVSRRRVIALRVVIHADTSPKCRGG